MPGLQPKCMTMVTPVVMTVVDDACGRPLLAADDGDDGDDGGDDDA